MAELTPELVVVGTRIRVGASTAATDQGDLSAGDGTRSLTWDASTSKLDIVGTAGASTVVAATNTATTSTAGLRTVSENGDFVFQSRGSAAGYLNNTALIQASVGLVGGIVINANDPSGVLSFRTQDIRRWTITSAGDLITSTGADNVHDIGASGASRPRTGYFGTSINVGNGITPSTANGDSVFGDGTRSMAWDASAGSLTITGTTTGTDKLLVDYDADSFISATVTNQSAGAGAGARFLVNGETASGALIAYSGANATYPDEVHIIAFGTPAALGLRTNAAVPIDFWTTATKRWSIGSGGHFVGATDNTYDIGASGASRPRTGYFGTSINVGNGITPSTANGDIVAGDGAREWSFDASGGRVTLTGINASQSSGHHYVEGNFVGNVNSYVRNLNSGGAAVIRLQDDLGDNLSLVSYGSALAGGSRTEIGSSKPLRIYTGGADPIRFATNGVGQIRWEINSTGHLIAPTDNTLDIGASGATRPRTGYFGRSLFVGTPAAEPTDEGSFAAGGNFDGVLRNDLNNASVGANAVASVKAASNVGGIQIRSLGSNHATLPAGAELLADSGITGGLVIRTTGTVECDILFSAGAGFGNHDWAIKSSLTPGARGHLVTGTDNTYDIGASGATRPRSGFFGTTVNVGDVAPNTVAGSFRAGNGSENLLWRPDSGGQLFIGATGALRAFVVQTDRNGDNIISHTNINTGASAQASLRLECDGTYIQIGAQGGGNTGSISTGGTGDLRLATGASGDDILFRPNNTTTFLFQGSTGHLLPATTNDYDIGSTSLRVRNIYYAGTLTGSGPATFDYLNVGSTTAASSTGDLAAGDGTNSMTYDASNDLLTVGEMTNPSLATITESGARLFGNGTIQSVRLDAATNNATENLQLVRSSTGTPAAGLGVSISFRLESATFGEINQAGLITTAWQSQDGVTGPFYDSAEMRFNVQSANNGYPNDAFTRALTLRGIGGGGFAHSAQFAGCLRVGANAADGTGAGDIVAGDGTREMFWDASTGEERLTSGFLNVGSNAATFNAGPASASGGLYASNNVNGYVYYHPTASQLICHYYDSGTNTVGTSFSISHGTSATPVAGFGTGFFFEGMSSTSVNRALGSHECVWTTATDASRTADMVFKVSKEPDGAGNTLEAGRFRGSDLSLKVTNRGDFGTALNVGTGITPSADNGDIVAGDGTRSMAWDASAGTLAVTGTATTVNVVEFLNQATGTGTTPGMFLTNTEGAVSRNLQFEGVSYSGATTTQQGSAVYLRGGSNFSNNTLSNFTGGATVGLTAGDCNGAGEGGWITLVAGRGSWNYNTASAQGTGQGGPIVFYTASTNTWTARWSVHADGHLVAGVRSQGGGVDGDNLYDIGSHDGGTTDSRPRTIYAGTSIEVGTSPGTTAQGDILAGSSASNQLHYDDSENTLTILSNSSFNAVTLDTGGTVAAVLARYAAGSGAVTRGVSIWNSSSGAAIGNGASYDIEINQGTDTWVVGCRIAGVATSVGSGTADADVVTSVIQSGSLTEAHRVRGADLATVIAGDLVGTGTTTVTTDGASAITIDAGGAAAVNVGTTNATSVSVGRSAGNLGFYGATPVAQSATYTVTNAATDRAYDANATTVNELADVLGTLIADLKALGLIG